ncbi:hypothetical protein HDU96_009392 [Phlyctochytrium bullatum]|nr:hypothetical protein HDU96_009392 [Phlyctochytrium bullatum]
MVWEVIGYILLYRSPTDEIFYFSLVGNMVFHLGERYAALWWHNRSLLRQIHNHPATDAKADSHVTVVQTEETENDQGKNEQTAADEAPPSKDYLSPYTTAREVPKLGGASTLGAPPSIRPKGSASILDASIGSTIAIQSAPSAADPQDGKVSIAMAALLPSNQGNSCTQQGLSRSPTTRSVLADVTALRSGDEGVRQKTRRPSGERSSLSRTPTRMSFSGGQKAILESQFNTQKTREISLLPESSSALGLTTPENRSFESPLVTTDVRSSGSALDDPEALPMFQAEEREAICGDGEKDPPIPFVAAHPSIKYGILRIALLTADWAAMILGGVMILLFASTAFESSSYATFYYRVPVSKLITRMATAPIIVIFSDVISILMEKRLVIAFDLVQSVKECRECKLLPASYVYIVTIVCAVSSSLILADTGAFYDAPTYAQGRRKYLF